MAVLGYLAKLKRDLGLAFGAHFQHHFSIIMFLTEYSINGQSFNVTPYSFSRYQTKCVIKFLFRFFLDQPVKQWLTRRKRGEGENT